MRLPKLLQKCWEKNDFAVEYIDGIIDISAYSPSGQDWHVEVAAENLSQLVHVLYSQWKDYDPDYEATLWIGEDGHGKDGAPYHIQDIVEDMMKCRRYLEYLYRSANVFSKSNFFISAEELGWEVLHSQKTGFLETGIHTVNDTDYIRVLKQKSSAQFVLMEARRLVGTDNFIIMKPCTIDTSAHLCEDTFTGYDKETESTIFSFHSTLEEFKEAYKTENSQNKAVAEMLFSERAQINHQYELADEPTTEDILIAEMRKYGKNTEENS